MKKQITIRSLAMLALVMLLSFTGFSQVATSSLQTVGNATLSIVKQKQDTIAQSLRLQATAANQAIQTTSLGVLKAKLDSVNQFLRALESGSVTVTNTVTVAAHNVTVSNSPSVTVLNPSVTITGTANVSVTNTNISTSSLQYAQRPSEKSGRVHKSGILVSQSVTATSYTVTGGKTLYITSITLSAINSNTSTVGSIIIQDNATQKTPLLIPASATTGQNASSFIQMTFIEPRQFSTNVNVTIVSGTVNYSMSWTGYEE